MEQSVIRSDGTAPGRVGPLFVTLYVLAYMGTWLALLSPVLVTLALKVNALVGKDEAPATLGLVAGVGALIAMFGNPLFGKLSDRTTSRWGMRRPWMLGGLAGGIAGLAVVSIAPSVPVLLVGWSVTQLAFNAILAAQVAVLPDQVPVESRGLVSGVLGVALPIALVSGTFVVQFVAPNQLAMFLVPAVLGGLFIAAFALLLKDRKLPPENKPAWSLREFLATFYVNPRQQPDFAWAFVSRFLFILAFAFLTTYQAFYLIDHLGSAQDAVPRQIFLATLANSACVILSSVIGGRISDRTGRRKTFVLVAAAVFGGALVIIATATGFNGFVIGMAVAGLGFGVYTAVDLALVTDVLPDPDNAAKDLGVFNIASALPQSVAPAIAPALLAIGNGSYPFLYAVAAASAVFSAVSILKVRGVR